MKRKHNIQILLVIVISFLLPLLPAYIEYYDIMEADFPSAHPKFENRDLYCMFLFEKQNITAISGYSYSFWLASNLNEHFSCFYYQGMFPQTKTLVLRC